MNCFYENCKNINCDSSDWYCKKHFDELKEKCVNETCSICLDDLKDSSCFFMKSCRHAFHRDCISSIKKTECPNCKSQIKDDEIKKDIQKNNYFESQRVSPMTVIFSCSEFLIKNVDLLTPKQWLNLSLNESITFAESRDEKKIRQILNLE